MIPVALVGATGYTGAELLRLLLPHPRVDLKLLCGHSTAGQSAAETLPSLVGADLPGITRFDAEAIAKQCKYAFLAVPHGTAQEATAALLAANVRVIDLSADHRFDDPAQYGAIYKPHAHPESLAHTVYGLPEHHRERIRGTRLVGVPGCYPTAVTLGAAPAIQAGLVRGEILADCKSGVTGAGRKPGPGTHYPETADGLHAYKTLAHRHAPEMTRNLGGVTVHFVPHLVPMNRGILATLYLRVDAAPDQVREVYEAAYADEPFVHLLPEGQHPDTRHVRGTNRCHIGLFMDGDVLVVQSVIDNLGKGAAGQAIQCFNLMAGLPETAGLTQTALFV